MADPQHASVTAQPHKVIRFILGPTLLPKLQRDSNMSTINSGPRSAHQIGNRNLEARSLSADTALAHFRGRALEANRGVPLNLDWVEDVHVNTSAVERRAQSLVTRRTVKKDYQAAWLLRAISCMDLTTLSRRRHRRARPPPLRQRPPADPSTNSSQNSASNRSKSKSPPSASITSS